MTKKKNQEKQENSKIDYGHEVMTWHIKEFEQHTRDSGWYALAGLIAFVFLIFAFWTNNFLFAVIIILALFIIILHHENDPIDVEFFITTEGVVVGKKFTAYSELKNFAIVYQPREGIKRLYFEPKNFLKYRVSIPLQSQDPLKIRENLLNYLPEDLDREGEPFSENISRLLKL